MPSRNAWESAGNEPSIADLLADPIAQTLMRADGVFVSEVLAIVADLRSRRSTASPFREFRPRAAIALSQSHN